MEDERKDKKSVSRSRSRSRKRSHSSTSSSSTSPERKKHKKSKKKYRKTRDRSSSSNSSSSEEYKKKKHKKKAKKIKKEKRKEERTKKCKKDKKSKEKETCSDVPISLMDRAKAMAPMTKEEWEKKQSVVKRVFDEETGRHRLIKGDGEVLEEIVSRDRHKAINRQATLGDGNFFQSKINSSLKK